jgi:YYY domain-containing protein
MNLFEKSISYIKAVIAGLISALLVSLGGNLTTIYAFLKPYTPADSPVPFWQLPFLPFTFPNNYWYPNATRFIYHTIHEFPIYSFVVSDLHGHVLDIPFVLLTILFIFVLLKNKKISSWHLIFLAFLFAVMYMTNAWDGPIYFLLAFMLLFVSNFYKDHRWLFSQYSFYQLLKQFFIIFFGFIIFSLPFSVNFRPFVSGIGILCTPSFLTSIGKFGPFLFEVNHCQRTPFWQFTLLYGFFYFFVISFLLFLKFKRKYQFSKSDIFVLMLIVLSSILILVPEFIYVKDIYPTYYRANTMFKLVYEAFILLSLSCGYILVKLITGIRRKKILIPFSMASFVLLFLVLIYPVFAINSYYNNLQTKNKSLDGTAYLASLYPNDYRLIIWLNKNVHGQPVILEASGDSYTDYARISANTGLPTVIGWSVHEWLWRGTYDVVAPRIADVQILYTTHNITTARSLIKKYNISYVVVSDLERQKYPSINEQSFVKLGKLIFESDQTKLYKINF